MVDAVRGAIRHRFRAPQRAPALPDLLQQLRRIDVVLGAVLSGEARGAQVFRSGGASDGTDDIASAVRNQLAMGAEDQIGQFAGQVRAFETAAYKRTALHELIRRGGIERSQFGAQIEDFEEAGVGGGAYDESGRDREAVAQQFAEVGALASDRSCVAGTDFVQ
jgi:hypothetical protein